MSRRSRSREAAAPSSATARKISNERCRTDRGARSAVSSFSSSNARSRAPRQYEDSSGSIPPLPAARMKRGILVSPPRVAETPRMKVSGTWEVG